MALLLCEGQEPIARAAVPRIAAAPRITIARFLKYHTAGGASTQVPGRAPATVARYDAIEPGIAFLTALMFIRGEHHVWGDGSDGTIVGPGRMPAGA